jgi:hypothetical protein
LIDFEERQLSHHSNIVKIKVGGGYNSITMQESKYLQAENW